eukprot:5518552-Lingulodinium_polyedra.AAC.1
MHAQVHLPTKGGIGMRDQSAALPPHNTSRPIACKFMPSARCLPWPPSISHHQSALLSLCAGNDDWILVWCVAFIRAR